MTTHKGRPSNARRDQNAESAPQDFDIKESTQIDIDREDDSLRDKFRIIRSPIQLTHIRDLPNDKNIDTVQLHDILGDPMIRECWQFNYCFDVDFVMSQFDQDVRDLVQVKIVHGSWKQDSANRIRIDVRSTSSFIDNAGD